MTAKVSLRSATDQDFKDVLEVSKGIYDGEDYLPFLYHSWLKSPNKYVFVAELQRKVIGLVIAAIIDGGQTAFCQSLRIHREYRGRGYGYQIMIDVIDHVRENHPQISKACLLARKNDQRMEYISKKLGYKPVMIRNCRYKSFELNNREVDIDRDTVNSNKELVELERKDADEFVLHQRRFDGLITNKTLVVANEVFELMSANAGIVFKDDDKMFTDVSVEELKQNIMPRSFSHGRMVIRINVQSWMCNIYANDRHAFKTQMVRQMTTALEQGENVCSNTQFKVLYSSDLDFEVQEIFEEVLGLEQAATIVHDDLVLHEKDISKQSLKVNDN